jgi:MerR family copper efflux transcriptional regulator
MELPIACSLDPGALEERRGRWRALAARALVDQHTTPSGVRQRYRPEPEVERELRDLAAAERECCGFASWDVRASEGSLELEVSSPGDGAAAVREMFAA